MLMQKSPNQPWTAQSHEEDAAELILWTGAFTKIPRIAQDTYNKISTRMRSRMPEALQRYVPEEYDRDDEAFWTTHEVDMRTMSTAVKTVCMCVSPAPDNT